jgi:hypothetical protein
MQRRNQLKKSPFKRNVVKTEVDMSKIQCYGCNQFGHYKNDCPKLKQKRPPFKKKSMMATWDELEEISDEEDQEANVCLMTRSEAEEVNLEPCSSCQKTEHLFDNLFYDTHILNQRNSQLKNELSNVTSDLEKFKNDNLVLKQKLEELQNSNNEMTKQIKEFQNKKEDNSSNFQKENILLKEKVSTLEKDITNFIKTTETFNNILGSQKGIFDKAGLGFETYKKQKLYKDFFIPQKIEEFKCKFCHKKGHIEMFCFKKKHKQEQTKNKLIKQNKGYSHKKHKTNNQGPKAIWVPKNSVNISAGMSLNHKEKTMVPRQWMLKTHDWGQKKFSISGEERRRISHFWK